MSFQEKFLAYFPVPSYLQMGAAGVDITERSVKYSLLKQKGSSTTIDNYGEIPLAKGTIAEGRVAKPEALAEALSRLSEEQGIYRVNVSLPEQVVFIAHMQIPKVRAKEVRATIELHIEEHIPISSQEAVFDFEVVNNPELRAKGEQEVVVTAATYDVLVDYYKAFETAGLQVLAMEPESHAAARALIDFSDKQTQMIVDIGHDHTSFSIAKGEVVHFSSSVSIGGEDITKAIMQDQKVTYEQAEHLKKTKGMERTGSDNALFFTIVRIGTILRDEINTRFSYWNEKYESANKITQIILSGGNAYIKGIDDYLTSGVNAGVNVGNPWTNILSLDERIPRIPAEEAMKYTTTLGLGLRNINRHAGM